MELACLKPTELGVPFYAFSLEFSASKAQGSAKVFLFLSALPAPPLLTTFSALFEQNCLFIDPPAPSLSWTGKYKKIFPCFFLLDRGGHCRAGLKGGGREGRLFPSPSTFSLGRRERRRERTGGRATRRPYARRGRKGNAGFIGSAFAVSPRPAHLTLTVRILGSSAGEGKSETKMTIDGKR